MVASTERKKLTPRFVLLWRRRRRETPVVICWTWSRYRAGMLAAQLEWEGRFEVCEEVRR